MLESIFLDKFLVNNTKLCILLQRRNGNQVFVVSVISIVARRHSGIDWKVKALLERNRDNFLTGVELCIAH